jgi:hypothetical protein
MPRIGRDQDRIGNESGFAFSDQLDRSVETDAELEREMAVRRILADPAVQIDIAVADEQRPHGI